MLNEKGVRELVYVVNIDAIEPIEGSDNCEAAVVGGWRVMVRKGIFKAGDLAIYFEIDSKVPELPCFDFLAKKHYAVKTQKYTFGGKGKFFSQGLIMTPEDFGWEVLEDESGEYILDKEKNTAYVAGDFLTERLGVTYAVAEDNSRKASSVDKYKKMAQRNGKLFAHQPFRAMMKTDWGKKALFLVFGNRSDSKSAWPNWVKKTDEERVQNIPWIVNDHDKEWIATEKIDGTSTTATVKKTLFGWDYFICSRNAVFTKDKTDCFYDKNVYIEMSDKYKLKDVLIDIAKKNKLEWVTLQGETFGAGVQKRSYGMNGHDFRGFNLIYSDRGRLNSVEAARIMKEYGIRWVPIVDEHFHMPETVDELLNIATDTSVIDGGMREGLVFRSVDGKDSFKAVSNEFLAKYHQ